MAQYTPQPTLRGNIPTIQMPYNPHNANPMYFPDQRTVQMAPSHPRHEMFAHMPVHQAPPHHGQNMAQHNHSFYHQDRVGPAQSMSSGGHIILAAQPTARRSFLHSPAQIMPVPQVPFRGEHVFNGAMLYNRAVHQEIGAREEARIQAQLHAQERRARQIREQQIQAQRAQTQFHAQQQFHPTTRPAFSYLSEPFASGPPLQLLLEGPSIHQNRTPNTQYYIQQNQPHRHENVPRKQQGEMFRPPTVQAKEPVPLPFAVPQAGLAHIFKCDPQNIEHYLKYLESISGSLENLKPEDMEEVPCVREENVVHLNEGLRSLLPPLIQSVLFRTMARPKDHDTSLLARCVRYAKSEAQREVDWAVHPDHIALIAERTNEYGIEKREERMLPVEKRPSLSDDELARLLLGARQADSEVE